MPCSIVPALIGNIGYPGWAISQQYKRAYICTEHLNPNCLPYCSLGLGLVAHDRYDCCPCSLQAQPCGPSTVLPQANAIVSYTGAEGQSGLRTGFSSGCCFPFASASFRYCQARDSRRANLQAAGPAPQQLPVSRAAAAGHKLQRRTTYTIVCSLGQFLSRATIDWPTAGLAASGWPMGPQA